jgi:D-serine deaminase-like pyridoxal phosphate-dependent protein
MSANPRNGLARAPESFKINSGIPITLREDQEMDQHYLIEDTSDIFSPALIFYKSLIRDNIRRGVQTVGDVDRLRPHIKTHKCREIVRMQMEAGITKFKCATIAEAELLASVGVRDVLLAYTIVGPNQKRVAHLVAKYPETRFSVLVDDPEVIKSLSETMRAGGVDVDVMLDVDSGMHRTGVPMGDRAARLYQLIHDLPGLVAAGLHVYDGNNNQPDFNERKANVEKLHREVVGFKTDLERMGLPVPKLVMGGTPQFGIYAQIPGVECSPGTYFVMDHGYRSKYADLNFPCAALLLSRVISVPSSDRIALDLGYKAVGADPPGDRFELLDVPNARQVLHAEEHLVVMTPQATRFKPGDTVYAVPTHICSTCVLHKFAYIVEGHRVVDRWEIAARDRSLGF